MKKNLKNLKINIELLDELFIDDSKEDLSDQIESILDNDEDGKILNILEDFIVDTNIGNDELFHILKSKIGREKAELIIKKLNPKDDILSFDIIYERIYSTKEEEIILLGKEQIEIKSKNIRYEKIFPSSIVLDRNISEDLSLFVHKSGKVGAIKYNDYSYQLCKKRKSIGFILLDNGDKYYINRKKKLKFEKLKAISFPMVNKKDTVLLVTKAKHHLKYAKGDLHIGIAKYNDCKIMKRAKKCYYSK